MTNCKCKTFIGSVEEMKGNEARVVFFLHPLDQPRDGKVAKKEPLRNSLGLVSLLFLGLLLGLGVLAYLFYPNVSTTSTAITKTTMTTAITTTRSTSTTILDYEDTDQSYKTAKTTTTTTATPQLVTA